MVKKVKESAQQSPPSLSWWRQENLCLKKDKIENKVLSSLKVKESAQQSAPLPLLVEGHRKTFAEKLKESEKMKIKM